uniref:Chitin-binding type-1 domain-containing protein n=1 Tax=Lygus hesperus TaxID=30085 RepID=A0A146LX78_LYGHE
MREASRFLISVVVFYGIIASTSSATSVLGAPQQNSSALLQVIILDYFRTNKRWWTDENLYCGRSAPLYQGYYPICDPFNPNTPCCSNYGHCGITVEHCNCTGCVDYSKNPAMLTKEPVRPTGEIIWHQLSDKINRSLPICGPNAPPIDGYEAICNPDDDYKYCCSQYGFCGHGSEFCDCKDCKNFRKIPKTASLVAVHGRSELRSIILDLFRKEKRWWAWDDDPKMRGTCGRKAPLYNGYYPVCNPFSPNSPCCNSYGYCGKNCNCTGCVDYMNAPERLLEEPVRPTQEIRWHLVTDEINWDYPICGPKAPKVRGFEAICNPDDDFSHCCSAQGFCGHGPEYCECEGCKNFRKIPVNETEAPQLPRPSQLKSLVLDYFATRKRWWTKDDDPKKVGMCGKRAPLYNGYYAVCDPFNAKTPCCSFQGHCGSSDEHCNCTGCVDYSKNPEMLLVNSGKPLGDIRWHILSDNIDPSHPKCGPRAPPINGSEAICNPDDDYGHCCSKYGFCGIGQTYCDCKGCINYRNIYKPVKTLNPTNQITINNSGASNGIHHQLANKTDSLEIGEIENERTTPTIDHN